MEEAIHKESVKHRIYLTVDDEYRPIMAQEIIKKCEEQGIPYYFKVFYSPREHQYNQQSDTMVLYLENDRQVVQYVNFINEIIEQNPEMTKHIHKPSPHLGIVNEFIGYGFEPQFQVNGDRVSYSQFMQNVIYKTFRKIPSIFNSFINDILNSIKRNRILYFEDAKQYCLDHPDCLRESLYTPSEEECEELLRYDGSRKDIDEEGRRQIKGRIKRVISTFYRIMRKEDRKGFPRLEDALKETLVKTYVNMPGKNMFGIEQPEIDYYRDSLDERDSM